MYEEGDNAKLIISNGLDDPKSNEKLPLVYTPEPQASETVVYAIDSSAPDRSADIVEAFRASNKTIIGAARARAKQRRLAREGGIE